MSRLHTAARRGDDETALACIAEGTDVNARNVSARASVLTPLMLAVVNKHESTVKLLLEARAQVNLAHPNGRTALHMAASGGNLRMVQLLIQHGADVNAQSKSGETAILEAGKFNHGDIVRFLEGAGG